MKEQKRYDLIIIGAGAAGCVAAITAGERGKSVLLLEKNPSIGKKILATGNGKCNFTNYEISKSCYHGDEQQITSVLDHFSTNDVIEFFHKIGILAIQKNGYVYPASGQAKSVVRAFEQKLYQLNVEVNCNSKVSSFFKDDNLFFVQTDSKEQYCSSNLLIASGLLDSSLKGVENSTFDSLNKLGHSLNPILPALCGFYCSGIPFKGIAGVRIHGKVSLFIDDHFIASDTGEIQFNEYGISGIPVFQLSSYASKALNEKKNVSFSLNLIPDMSKEEAILELAYRLENVKNPLNGWMPDKIESLITNFLNKESGVEDYYQVLSNLTINCDRYREHKFAQICIGGIPVNELSDHLVSSNKCSGLYFAGEILNVDGICGGYNLHFAWATGHYVGSII